MRLRHNQRARQVVTEANESKKKADPILAGCQDFKVSRKTEYNIPAHDEQRAQIFMPGTDTMIHQDSFMGDFEGDVELPLMVFQRAMVRLFKVLQQPQMAKMKTFATADANQNGSVGWYEFCSFWKQNDIRVQLSVAERVFLTLEDAERSILGRIISILVFSAILISTAGFVCSTLPGLQTSCALEGDADYVEGCKPDTQQIFQDIDLVCVIFFSIEYGTRVLLSAFMRLEIVDRDKNQLLEWLVTEDVIKMPAHWERMLAYFLHWANIIDLAAIMPWYLTQAFSGTGGEDSFIIRMIRLTRVIRAFRLGRRFEAVIIVTRSLKRSWRALYVLTLNLLLGVVIFAAMMYFCEQGEWSTERRRYMRWVTKEWNEDELKWDDIYEETPFYSIPSCFWWAMVTATTVGYGDKYSTTPAGKVNAGICMIWSLCVLALPIGVIGNNFSSVWDDYDREKEQEEWDRIREEMMLKRSIAWGDPSHYSRRLLVEVWHESGLGPGDGMDLSSEFLGEVDVMLTLPREHPIRERRQTEPLSVNFEKARRQVRGTLTFEYSWEPDTRRDTNSLLSGDLEVTMLSAEHLLNIDWKGIGATDPYCTVTVYPNSPDENGKVIPVTVRTDTLYDALHPVWDEPMRFKMNWTQDGAKNAVAEDMKDIQAVASHVPSDLIMHSSRVSPSTARTSSRAEDAKKTGSLRSSEPARGKRSETRPRTSPETRIAYTSEESREAKRSKTSKTLSTMPEKMPEKMPEMMPEKKGFQAPPDPTQERLPPRQAARRAIREMDAEVHELKMMVVPHLRQEIATVREDMQLILETLRKRPSLAPSRSGSGTLEDGSKRLSPYASTALPHASAESPELEATAPAAVSPTSHMS